MPRTLVILNPAAKSERAVGFSSRVEDLAAASSVVRLTAGPGEARALAEAAVGEGFEQVIAAGGDGTINEVVNGLAGSNVPLGVLPLGSMNVFAIQLGLPKDLRECWEVIQSGHVREIDLARANGHAFVQMGGVGLDAQALQATSRDSKRNFGPLSYVLAAAQIAARKPPCLLVSHGSETVEGSLALIGNGRYYGGPFPVFPKARMDDGLLDVLVFKNLSYFDIVRYMQGVLFGTHVSMEDVTYFTAACVTVTSDEPVPAEVDGEVIGQVPVTFDLHPRRLRVLSPPVPGG